MAINKLSFAKVDSAKKKDKDYRLADGGNLYLLVKKNGSKLWRLDYSFNGKRKTLALGSFSILTLANARKKATKAKQQLDAGIDPSALKQDEQKQKVEKQKRVDAGLPELNSFEAVAREWGKLNVNDWDTKNSRNRNLLVLHLFPKIGKLAIGEITLEQLQAPLFAVRDKGRLESARRCRNLCTRIFRFAMGKGICTVDITLPLAGTDNFPRQKTKPRASLTKPNDVAPLLRAIDQYNGSLIAKTALQIAPLVFVRPLELRSCKWAEVDLKNAQWSYLVTKTKTPHIVPLARQTIALFERLKPITGHGVYVFPSLRTPNGKRCMSENTLNSALRRMDYSKEQMCAHGFRAMARTMLEQELKFTYTIIEHQLAHMVRDTNGRAYNRTDLLDERAEMMQSWADYLDGLKNTPHNG